MYLGEPNKKSRVLFTIGLVGFLVLVFVLSFQNELKTFFEVLRDWEKLQDAGVRNSFGIILYNLLGFFLIGFLYMWMVSSQAILPVQNAKEVWRTIWRLLLYIVRLHGPAVFVKDGKVISTREDVRSGPGVIVVDFNSAVVLEETVPPPGIGRALEDFFHRVQVLLGLADRPQSPRVFGPGIVFMRKRERIRGTVDLRRQFRVIRGVTAYTRDGIEVYANVNCLFTIGQPPDIVEVTYEGRERDADHLRVIRFERVNHDYLRVGSIEDELERNDRREIHHVSHGLGERDYKPYTPLPPVSNQPEFDRERVFAAVFAQARSEDRVLPWTELPARFAASVFREILSQVRFDELYQLQGRTPGVANYRARLRNTVRNNGLLSYRMVFLKNGEPFQKRRVYHVSEIVVSEVFPLMNPKLLRDRGIKVISSNFGDINPVNEAIYHHRLESWRAPWQRDTAIRTASLEFEAMRILGRARAKAQVDLAIHLKEIFESGDLPDEVIAVRLLRSLETSASDPKTRQLLPPHTLEILRLLQGKIGGERDREGNR